MIKFFHFMSKLMKNRSKQVFIGLSRHIWMVFNRFLIVFSSFFTLFHVKWAARTLMTCVMTCIQPLSSSSSTTTTTLTHNTTCATCTWTCGDMSCHTCTCVCVWHTSVVDPHACHVHWCACHMHMCTCPQLNLTCCGTCAYVSRHANSLSHVLAEDSKRWHRHRGSTSKADRFFGPVFRTGF